VAAASSNDPESPKTKQHETGQSVPDPSVNGDPLDNMCGVITVVQQIMIKTVFSLMNENGK
jgi:hypothetical protein